MKRDGRWNLTLPARAAFGLEGNAKLPTRDDRTLLVLHDNRLWTVWIEPLFHRDNPPRGHYGRIRRRSAHRFMARCVCGKRLSVGRTHQHTCKARPTVEQGASR